MAQNERGNFEFGIDDGGVVEQKNINTVVGKTVKRYNEANKEMKKSKHTYADIKRKVANHKGKDPNTFYDEINGELE